MDLTTGLIVIAVIYLWFYFIDTFLKSCSHYAYIQFLKGTGLEIKQFQLRWTTTAFNRTLLKLASRLKLLNVWFNLGLYASLLLLPIAIIILFISIAQNYIIKYSNTDSSKIIAIEPILPGITLPASELGFYSFTLLVCSLVHELGHALAAINEDVNLINIGVNVIFILPITYVNINSEKLLSLNPWKRLKVLSAGIWHNLVIGLIAYLMLLSLPHVFSPFFYSNKGVTIINIHHKSPLIGVRGLNPGDKIIKINDCVINDADTWYDCLRTLKMTKPSFCIEADLVHNLDESVPLKHIENGVIDCCNKDTSSNICFEYLDSKDSILEFPPYVCLPARPVIEVSRNLCTSHPHLCPKNTFCFRPTLSNKTNLFKMKRLDKSDVIYIGLVSDLSNTVLVSTYIPKYLFDTTNVPDFITKLLNYIVIFSFGMSIVNIYPCLFMDGQHIINTIFFILFSNRLRPDRISLLSAIISVCFTLLLVIHFVYQVWSVIYNLYV